jgi:hypothetical protein
MSFVPGGVHSAAAQHHFAAVKPRATVIQICNIWLAPLAADRVAVMRTNDE